MNCLLFVYFWAIIITTTFDSKCWSTGIECKDTLLQMDDKMLVGDKAHIFLKQKTFDQIRWFLLTALFSYIEAPYL
jgi:hypothetical protein